MGYDVCTRWVLKAITHPGAECKLKYMQLDELRHYTIDGPTKCGFEMWAASLAIAHVRNKYNIEYTGSGMLCLLHRMGFSWRKTHPRHPNVPTKEEIKELKKDGRLARKYRRKNTL